MPIDSNDNQYVLTMIDRFSRFLLAIPLKDIKSKSIISAIYQDYISIFGLPVQITTDNASYFRSNEFSQFTTYLGIKVHYSIPCSPWMNGMIERQHIKLKTSLRAYSQSNWSVVHRINPEKQFNVWEPIYASSDCIWWKLKVAWCLSTVQFVIHLIKSSQV